MKIDRCICTEQSFQALLHQARDQNLNLVTLMEKSRAGTCCGLCRPYLRQCLKTGETVFHHLIVDDARTDRHDR